MTQTHQTQLDSGGMSRRRALSVGGLASLGLSLPDLLRLEANGAARSSTGRNTRSQNDSRLATPKAKSCILFFMEGGPSHIDLWDMKPEAPDQVRGIYKPIATSLPGVDVCEHLPMWSRIMDKLSVVRSLNHPIVDHNASSYYTVTGQYPMRGAELIRRPSSSNSPPIGAVFSKLRPSGQPLPDFVHLPKRVINCGSFIPGQLAGFLGSQYDPFIAGDPSKEDFRAPGLNPLPDLAGARIEDRRHLLDTIDGSLRQLDASRAFDRMDGFYQRAYSLIESPQARQAFDLSREPEKIRQRYGLGFKSNKGPRDGGGMPHLGPSMLLARRLVEAGVRLVSIWASGQAFDTHRNHFPTLTNSLCPYIDRSFSALIEDLDERGLLDETLVVAVGEFGRTPKMGQITSSAGATPDGRDHWSRCYTGFLAGGGAKPGMLYGSSDAYAAQPSDNPVTPAEFVATIYTLLGIDPHARLYDRLNRPHTITDADPIAAIMA